MCVICAAQEVYAICAVQEVCAICAAQEVCVICAVQELCVICATQEVLCGVCAAQEVICAVQEVCVRAGGVLWCVCRAGIPPARHILPPARHTVIMFRVGGMCGVCVPQQVCTYVWATVP